MDRALGFMQCSNAVEPSAYQWPRTKRRKGRARLDWVGLGWVGLVEKGK